LASVRTKLSKNRATSGAYNAIRSAVYRMNSKIKDDGDL